MATQNNPQQEGVTEQIKALIKERSEGGPNRLKEVLDIAAGAGIRDDWARKGYEDAERTLSETMEAWTAPDPFFVPLHNLKLTNLLVQLQSWDQNRLSR